MTVTVMEYDHPPTVVTPPADRDWIMRKREPPGNWLIFIGRYQGKRLKTWFRHTAFDFLDNDADSSSFIGPDVLNSSTSYNLQVTTLAVGEVMLQAFSSINLARQINPIAYADFLGLRCLWPEQDQEIIWHELPILGDGGVERAAEAFKELCINSRPVGGRRA